MKETLVFKDWTLAYFDLDNFIHSINTAKNVDLNLLQAEQVPTGFL